MQDRYTGDIGDFGKYGLLRALCRGDISGRRRLKLGINWYLVPDAGNPNDGSLINYLRNDSSQAYLKSSDPQLYALLQGIVFPVENESMPGSHAETAIPQKNDLMPRSGTKIAILPKEEFTLHRGTEIMISQENDVTLIRNAKTLFSQESEAALNNSARTVFQKENDSGPVSCAREEADNCSRRNCPSKEELDKCIFRRCLTKVERRGVLPDDTLFYNALLEYPPNSTVAARTNIRDSWVRAGFALLADCDVVFFDPDNGLQVGAYGRYSPGGNKYAFDDEIAGYYKRGQSIIIYQHRSMERDTIYLQRIRNSINNITGRKGFKAFRLRYRRGTARDFIIIPNHRHPRHRTLVEKRIDAMLPAWRGRGHNSAHFEKYNI